MMRVSYLPLGKDRGDALIDALTAFAISSIVGLGMFMTMANSVTGEARDKYQNEAVFQMRNLFEQQGYAMCSAQNNVVLSNNVSLSIITQCTQITVNVPNYGTPLSTTVQKIKMSVSSLQYFGVPGQIIIQQ